MSVLDDIVAGTRARLSSDPPDEAALEERIARMRPARDVLSALTEGIEPGALGQNRIIAEVKRRSPSLGVLALEADALAVAKRYVAAGAAAISVLTEPERFGGSFADLLAVSEGVAAPTLCKDFIVDRRQVMMARAHGASLVLLIVAALSDLELVVLREAIETRGMQALVEVHDREQVRRALACGARIVGVNSRDLHTLAIDLAVAEALRPELPDQVVAIAESGIRAPEDIARLRRAGYRRFLVGSSLMQADDPAALLRAMIATRDQVENAP